MAAPHVVPPDFPPVVLRFDVGRDERHDVVCGYDQWWGVLAVMVDGTQVLRDQRHFSLSLSHDHFFPVGVWERHQVCIRKTRPLVLAGFRKQTLTAFVDGYPVAEGTSRLSKR